MSNERSEFPRERVVPGSTDDPTQSGSVPGIAAPPSINQFIMERDEALMSLDEKKIRSYFRKWGGGQDRLPADPLTFWCSVHKAITAAVSIPMEHRRRSKRWLIERNFRPLDDGEISLSGE